MRGLELGEAGAQLERLQHWLGAVLEPEPRQLVDRLRLEDEVRPELAQVVDQALLGEVGPHAEVDHVAVIDRDPVEHRQRDPIVEHEVAALEGERARRALRDQPAAQLEHLIGREPHRVGEHVDLVAIGRQREPPRDVGDLGRGDEVVGQRDARERIGGQR